MVPIEKVHSRYIYDSRGNPTVEVEVTTSKGTFRADVPSGASTGSKEAVELRDKDTTKWNGKGVLKAVSGVNDIIAPALVKAKLDVLNQAAVDNYLINLDGTPNKANLGANAILGVSLAVARAAVAELGIPLYAYISELVGTKKPYVLPVPFQNVLNGGVHAGGLLAPQEFMLAPIGFDKFSDAFRANSEIYHILKKDAEKKYGPGAGNVGDEGGIAPSLDYAEQALDLIVGAIKEAGYEGKVFIAMDPASSEFFSDGKYDLDFKNPHPSAAKKLSGDKMIEYWKGIVAKYPLVFIEDPFSEDDWETWEKFEPWAKQQGLQIVTDDITCTNPKIVSQAIEHKIGSALLVKLNQVGTLTETIEAVKLCYRNGWGTLVSHRSGETEDPFIADLAVGIRSAQLKSGAPARSERTAKYNQLLRIEEELGSNAVFGGKNFKKSASL